MKKIFLTMVALLSMTAMMAQDNNNGERKAPKQLTPEEMTEKMATDLSLTAEQKAKVLDLQKEYQDINRGPRMGGMRGPRPQADGQSGATAQRPERPQLTEEQKAEMQKQMERRREYNDKLKGILTAEQFEKYQKQFRHGGPRPGGFGRGPRPGGPRPE